MSMFNNEVYAEWDVKCLQCGNNLVGAHPWEKDEPTPVSCAGCGKWQIVYPEHKEITDERIYNAEYIDTLLKDKDFDTPNAEMARESKEMRATRHYIPKKTVIEAGKIRVI